MHDTAVLDLGMLPQFAAPAKPRDVPPYVIGHVIWSLVAALIVAVGFSQLVGMTGVRSAMAAIGLIEPAKPGSVRIDFDQLRMVASLNVDDKAQIVVEGIDAQQRNAAIPVSALPTESARSFLISQSGQAASGTALKCLTQAIYYEAGFESETGKRAVAQVILNRMRHPAYPKSVCGVVYQGSERRTGCQFSFTCDGALLRAPARDAWRDAAAIAAASLAGQVEPSVGTATHYHADYVLPKWAFQLAKIEQIGAHIFYRFTGIWGKSAAFSGRYSGIEQIPALNVLALRERALLDDSSANPADQFVPGLTVTPDVSDRHAATDVGGRIDTTKQWRLTIPDPVQASSRYREAIGAAPAPAASPGTHVAANDPAQSASVQ